MLFANRKQENIDYGISLGGLFCFTLCNFHPERVNSLRVFGTEVCDAKKTAGKSRIIMFVSCQSKSLKVSDSKKDFIRFYYPGQWQNLILVLELTNIICPTLVVWRKGFCKRKGIYRTGREDSKRTVKYHKEIRPCGESTGARGISRTVGGLEGLKFFPKLYIMV